MKVLNNRIVRYIFMAVVLCLIVYDFYYIPILEKDLLESIHFSTSCPNSGFVDRVGQQWSDSYWEDNPKASAEEWTAQWNRVMRAMNCDDRTVTIEEARENFKK